jgi:hypothetical protein
LGGAGAGERKVIVAADVAELVVQGAVGLGAAAIGAAATLYATTKAASGALTTAIEVDRAERRAEYHQARLVALTALLTELQLNSKALPDSHVWHAHLLLPQSALDAALPHIVNLPTDVAVAIETARHAVARYNGAAQYSNERVQVGNGAADATVRELAKDAQAALDAAAEALDEGIKKETTTHAQRS